ncbi:MAG: preprotein translocase subunit YajC [Bacteroidia bacterium]
MLNILILLQTDATTTTGSGGLGGMEQFLFFGGIIAIFYFFMIRPQQKKAKEERVFREGLSKGDKVITIGGIYGQVESIDEKSALVKVDSNVKLRFDKTALRPAPAAENEK